jgi:hypothetical protein
MFSEVDLDDSPAFMPVPTAILGAGDWRMRRRPETPSPCSCSGTTGDLAILSKEPASIDIRFAVSTTRGAPRAYERRFPVLLFFGSGASLLPNRDCRNLGRES